MAIEFTLRQNTTIPMDLRSIQPDVLASRSLNEIRAMQVPHGNRTVELADLFQIEGDSADGCLVFRGDLSSADYLGADLQAGHIKACGHVGHQVGARMKGGSIDVAGNAGNDAGLEMTGGLLRVAGDAGENAGGNGIGRDRGMQGGALLVYGNAGARPACRMRRGLVAIAGQAGELAGWEMKAGTLFLGGQVGRHLGHGMRRGTIVLAANDTRSLGASFVFGCRSRPLAMQLMLRQLQRLAFPGISLERTWDLYHGDMLAGGRGEVFLAA